MAITDPVTKMTLDYLLYLHELDSMSLTSFQRIEFLLSFESLGGKPCFGIGRAVEQVLS